MERRINLKLADWTNTGATVYMDKIHFRPILPEEEAFYGSRTANPATKVNTPWTQRILLTASDTGPYGLQFREIYGPQGDNTDEPHLYTGQEREPKLGLYYMGGRWMGLDEGRFLQADPYREFRNSFSYVGNNPIMFTDPTGNETVAEMLERTGTEAVGKGENVKAFSLAFLFRAWEFFGMEAVSGLTDASMTESKDISTGNTAMAVVEVVTLGKGGGAVAAGRKFIPSIWAKFSGKTATVADEGTDLAQNAKKLTNVPEIMPGTHGEMLGKALNHLKSFPGNAAKKADFFDNFAKQMKKTSADSWQAAREIGSDGSHIFLGRQGEALVIDIQGRIFRGNMGSFSIESSGKLLPNFEKLKEIK